MRKTLTILYSFLLVLFCTTGSAQENADKEGLIAMTITYPWNENPVEINDNYSYYFKNKSERKLAFESEPYNVTKDNEMELRFTSFIIRPNVDKQKKSNYYDLERISKVPYLNIIFNEQEINDLTATDVSYIEMDGSDATGTKRYIKVIINPTKKTETSNQTVAGNNTLISDIKRLNEKTVALESELIKLTDDAPFNRLSLWLAICLAVIAIASCVFVIIRLFHMKNELSYIESKIENHIKESDNSCNFGIRSTQDVNVPKFDNSKNEERLLKIENDLKDIVEKINACNESKDKVEAQIPHSKKTFTVDGLDNFNDNTITNNLSYVEGIFKLVQIADNKIEFMVNENTEIQRNNMQSIHDIVFRHCIKNNIVPRINRIINDKPGVLEKTDGKWEIVEKAKIMLE